jgi:hypothetical protein
MRNPFKRKVQSSPPQWSKPLAEVIMGVVSTELHGIRQDGLTVRHVHEHKPMPLPASGQAHFKRINGSRVSSNDFVVSDSGSALMFTPPGLYYQMMDDGKMQPVVDMIELQFYWRYQ